MSSIKRTSMKIIFVLVVVLLLLFGCTKNNVITLGHEITLESTALGEDRVMSIYLPEGYADSEIKYPVLYLLDGETHFYHTCGAVQYLSSNGYMPEMIVVALQNIDRNRDFSPVHVDNIPTSGGADEFLSFISDELKPHIDKLYRTSSYNVLFGHSFGGVFATYSLIEKPGLFDAYISISPFLQFADNYMVTEVEKKLRLLKKPVSFFMSIGDEPPYFEALEKTSDLFIKKQDPNFHFNYEMINTEDHMSNPYISLYKGLRFVFNDWQIPDDIINLGLDAINGYYENISVKYGQKTIPPENILNNMGYALLQNNDIENAITVFKANTLFYPESPNVYDSYGEALEANGQLDLAKENFKKAWDLGVEQDHMFVNIFKANYERVK